MALLAQNPANGIADVAFSAAIRPYNSRDAGIKGDIGFPVKRLEP
jgi:hypothetical protein